MRKVFISEALISPPTDNPRETLHQSRDLDLGERQFLFPISYLIDDNISAEDEILVATGLSQTPNRTKNYRLLQREAEEILSACGARAEFIVIHEPDTFKQREMQDALSFGSYLKDVADILQDGDRIYVDMTYGFKCYTLAMFIAISYAVRSCKQASVERMIYAQRYTGRDEMPNTADIIDITALFRINSIIAESSPGQKEKTDRLLSFMLG